MLAHTHVTYFFGMYSLFLIAVCISLVLMNFTWWGKLTLISKVTQVTHICVASPCQDRCTCSGCPSQEHSTSQVRTNPKTNATNAKDCQREYILLNWVEGRELLGSGKSCFRTRRELVPVLLSFSYSEFSSSLNFVLLSKIFLCRRIGEFDLLFKWKMIFFSSPSPSNASILEHEENSLRRKKERWKQGRIHGYLSRVRVGRGGFWGHFIIWAGAVGPKTTKTQKK